MMNERDREGGKREREGRRSRGGGGGLAEKNERDKRATSQRERKMLMERVDGRMNETHTFTNTSSVLLAADLP